MGMSHRVGYVKEGWDADLVIWDSHPLSLGATPVQVFIDGIAQLSSPHVTRKPDVFQRTPKVPNFDKEAKAAIKYEGLPPLEPKKAKTDVVVFANVANVYQRVHDDIKEIFSANEKQELGTVVVENGKLTCSGSSSACLSSSLLERAEVIDLRGGSITPGLTTFGSNLGLQEIDGEPSTGDGLVFDPLTHKVPSILGGDATLTQAIDGLQFGGRDALLAYRAGVVSAITAPRGRGFYAGLSTSFSTGALNKLEEGAIIQDVNALHVSVRHFGTSPSVSTQIGALRTLLLDPPKGSAGKWFHDVAEGKVTLVVDADSADIIATLILLKREVEDKTGNTIHLTITGALEAHLLAKELAEAKVGIIQVPSRPFPTVWDRRRILPGHPLSEESSIQVLLKHNVTVGIGIEESWSARNTGFDIGWLAIDAGGSITKAQAIALGSTNVEKLLGGKVETSEAHELVATEGGDLFDLGSRVRAVISPRRGLVDLL
ncbi:hypothetical protein PHLCEN_2v6470 [Hermanssonia centrifuga]|uniref:Amidohydrolase-related domain-containing protein n=1 Tax=Hermanssonia centrifuga TaxID=98765 RepID=A0A2R6NZW3_9APHY|nr:hypothetical protein PHLCEN_2v6470 [Hermanssonia centrifuga]